MGIVRRCKKFKNISTKIDKVNSKHLRLKKTQERLRNSLQKLEAARLRLIEMEDTCIVYWHLTRDEHDAIRKCIARVEKKILDNENQLGYLASEYLPLVKNNDFFLLCPFKDMFLEVIKLEDSIISKVLPRLQLLFRETDQFVKYAERCGTLLTQLLDGDDVVVNSNFPTSFYFC